MTERTPTALVDLMGASLGEKEIDLLLVGARVLDVYRGQWVEANVGMHAGRVVSFGPRELPTRQVVDLSGRWLVPGFFDPHFHAGGCHLSPTSLAAALLRRGTTLTVCDFQEHYAVAGPDAVRFALDEAYDAGLRVHYLVPIQAYCVRRIDHMVREMVIDDLREMLTWPETVAINEPPPGALFSADPEHLEIVAEALRRRLIYSGHAPELSGARLEAYVATGASSDHESGDEESAWAKLGLGMKVIMREGSAAPDLSQLVDLARRHPLATRHMSLGTDEVDPVDLSRRGHQDHKLRMAIAAGVDPIVALQMVTLNPAEYYRIDHEIGSLAPGRLADAVVLDDLEQVSVTAVFAGGRQIDLSDPLAGARPPAAYPEFVTSRVRLDRPLEADDLRLEAPGPTAVASVIEVSDGTLVKGAGRALVEVVGGSVPADPSRDLLKICVMERSSGRGERSIALVRGFGIQEGAVATTYTHSSYGVLTVGADEGSMAIAINRLRELGGGIVVVGGGRVTAEWDLPIVGVFATEPLDAVVGDFERMNEAIRALGCRFAAPVLALSFAALVSIPAYGLSARGLWDVASGEFVPAVSSEAAAA